MVPIDKKNEHFKTIFVGLEYQASSALYVKINQQVEKWSEIIYFIISKVSPQCIGLPIFIASLFAYFTTDLKNEALELPYAMW